MEDAIGSVVSFATDKVIGEDGSIKEECFVNVESLMYKKEKKSSAKPFILVAIALLALFTVKMIAAPSKKI